MAAKSEPDARPGKPVTVHAVTVVFDADGNILTAQLGSGEITALLAMQRALHIVQAEVAERIAGALMGALAGREAQEERPAG